MTLMLEFINVMCSPTIENQNTDKVRKGPAKANVLMYTSAYGDKQVCKS